MYKQMKYSLLQNIILAILYFIAGKFSLLFLHGNNIVNMGIFASEGIALAFILFFGKKVWIGIFIGQFYLAYYNDLPLVTSVGIAATNSFEALLGCYLFKKFNLNINLKTFRDIFYLIGIIFFIQLISASISNILLLVNGVISSKDYFESSFSWWFGNVMGQLLFTPFLLLTFKNYRKIKLNDYLIYISVFTLIIYSLEIIIEISNLMLLLSLSIPFIVFVVSYKGFVYGTAMSVVLALVSSYSVYLGQGVFHLSNSINNVINYNLFILAHISMVFITGILFEERRRNLLSLEQKVFQETDKNKKQQFILLQQSRLAQMGEMIAMIAHQWRQPLNNLSLANQLLISKYYKGKLNDATVEIFKTNSQKQIKHMSKTIDDFRNFFRSEQQSQDFCINDVVENILEITQNIYKSSGIKLSFNTQQKFYTNGYANELGQAILNIINNAKDALEELDIDEKYILIKLLKQQDTICICIEDNAGGIPEDIHEKVFDPYFSTKKNKNGTGLGLYMTKMIIIEKLHGEIHFNNTEKGVIFKIQLKDTPHAT